MDPVKFVFVHPTLAYQGGAELTLLWMSTELVKRGHEVSIVCGEADPQVTAVLPEQVHITTLNRSPVHKEWVDMPEPVWDEFRSADVVCPHNYPSYLCMARKPDGLPPVIHFCQEPPQRLYAWQTQRHFLGQFPKQWGSWLWLASQVSIRARNLTARLKGWQKLDHEALKRCDGILANSSFTADNVKSLHGIEATVCHLGIPSLSGGDYKDNRDITPFRQVIIPGRWSAIKNLETALKAFKAVNTRHPGLLKPSRVTVIGEGWQKRWLIRKLTGLGLSDIVTIRDLVPHRDMFSLYEEHQCVLYIPFDEPFGLVAIEAMAAGRTVIGARQGGIRETIRPDSSGLLVAPDSVDEICSALITVLSDPERSEKMGEQGKIHYQDRFTVVHFVDRFLEYIQSIRNSHAG